MAPAAAPAAPRATWLAYLVTPDASLNYSFLVAVYALLSLLSLALAAVQHVWSDAGVAGYWIVCAPCVPGLAYFLFLRARQRAMEAGGKKKD